VIPLNRERRYLLIGGMVLLLAGAVYRFYPGFSNVVTKPDEVTFKENELIKYRKALQEKNLLEEELLSAERELARNEAALLSKGTAALAAVDIQNMINDFAQQKKIEIKSMRVRKAKPLDSSGYMTVPVEITMITSIRQLKDMLFGIENSQKLLKVSTIRIRQPNINRPEELYCTFVVEGFMKSD
jgi:hypothetical protein